MIIMFIKISLLIYKYKTINIFRNISENLNGTFELCNLKMKIFYI